MLCLGINMSFTSVVNKCFIKISIILIGIISLCFYLKDILYSIFSYNIQINSIILAFIIIGVALIYLRLFMYKTEYKKLLNYDNLESRDIQKLRVLKPVTFYLTKNNKIVSQAKVQTILSGCDKKIDDYNAFPKYIAGTLIFLGLLGTFWGLSNTIGNVAQIIDNLGVEQQDAAASFLQLKNSLKIPLQGMGVAFGCSLFGLSGSLLVGLLILNMRSVSDKFIDSVEEWITKKTISFDVVEKSHDYHGSVFSMGLLEKTIETIYAFQGQLRDLDSNRVSLYEMQQSIANKLLQLTDSMDKNQDILKMLFTNQNDLQGIMNVLSKRSNDGILVDIVAKLGSIDNAINHMIQESLNSRKVITQSLGSDIRMVTKTLSSLVRE